MVKFEITESDIQKYLKKHKNDINIKYKEAMFVKYMKERSTEITAESLEILLMKYNFDDVSLALGIYNYNQSGNIIQNGLYNFPFYLSNIRNLDISGICHIMIPMLSYYDERMGYKNYRCHQKLSSICKKMNINESYEVRDNAIEDMKENYLLGFGNKFVYRENQDTYFRFSKEMSRRMIYTYADIYGEEPVKQIRKIIRERV